MSFMHTGNPQALKNLAVKLSCGGHILLMASKSMTLTFVLKRAILDFVASRYILVLQSHFDPGYVQTLKEAVRSRARKEEATPIERPPVPAPLSSAYFHPDKTEAVNNMQSRYKLLWVVPFLCFLDFSVGVGAFVIGLSQISSFLFLF